VQVAHDADAETSGKSGVHGDRTDWLDVIRARVDSGSSSRSRSNQ